MPIHLDSPGAGSSGIRITYTPSASRVDVSAWYDTCVGIMGGSYSLCEFLGALGITQKDCDRAFKRATLDGGTV